MKCALAASALCNARAARCGTVAFVALAAFFAVAPSLHAQQPGASIVPATVSEPTLPSTTPLAITIAPASIEQASSPLFVTITLTNTADHDIRLPQPEIGCTDTHNGYVALEVQFIPATASPQPDPQTETACSEASVSNDAASDNPAAHWLTLAPGDTANFAQRLPAANGARSAGTYTIRGAYTPPQVSGAAAERLYSLSVSYPTEPLTSAPVTFVRKHDGATTTAGLF
jgi:hypothetical protein